MATRSNMSVLHTNELPKLSRKRKSNDTPIIINIDLTHYNSLDPIDTIGYDTLRGAICIQDGPISTRQIIDLCEPIVRARLPVGRLAMAKFKVSAKIIKLPVDPTRCFDSIASALSYGIIIATIDNTQIIVYERSHKDNSYRSIQTTIVLDAGDILIMRGDLVYFRKDASFQNTTKPFIQTYVGYDKRFK
jgi:hypothetical protein